MAMTGDPQRELPSLPLLVRELLATANRRRTYWTRSLMVACLFAVYGLQYLEAALLGQGDLLSTLGHGGAIERFLFATCAVLLAAVVLLQSTTCFVMEKERGTLAVLMVTPLGPWRLAVEQWATQMVVSASVLLLALPLLALGYAFGGIPLGQVGAMGVALLLMMAQLGAIGVCAGCIAGAARDAVAIALLLGAILYGGAFYAGDAVGGGAGSLLVDLTPSGILHRAAASRSGTGAGWPWLLASIALPLAPVAALLAGAGAALRRWRERTEPTVEQRRTVWRRPPGRALPRADIVGWLAWRQSFMSRMFYRILLWCTIGLSLLAAVASAVTDHRYSAGGSIAWLLILLCMVTLAVSSAGALPMERTRQTLDVLQHNADNGGGPDRRGYAPLSSAHDARDGRGAGTGPACFVDRIKRQPPLGALWVHAARQRIPANPDDARRPCRGAAQCARPRHTDRPHGRGRSELPDRRRAYGPS